MKELAISIPYLVFTSFLLFQSCKSNPDPKITAEPIPADAWKIPSDVDKLTVPVDSIPPSREEWLRFGWNSFVALNWPADNNWPEIGNGGKPAMHMNITDPGADSLHTVWQTYLEPGQVFLAKGTDPGSWDDPVNPIHTKLHNGKELPILGGFEEKGIYFLNQNPEVGLVLYDLAITPNPVIDQNNNYVLLESRLNQSEFEYFKRTGYCDACKQSVDIAKGTFEYMDSLANSSLPEWARQGALEIKASWKILVEGKDINSRYYTTKGY
ncbi:MAG: hypothetical protein JKY48_15940, partial [Flavobacteriales bacterium]|nr:hypothetical protein [Flavobacteriales bacterium]